VGAVDRAPVSADGALSRAAVAPSELELEQVAVQGGWVIHVLGNGSKPRNVPVGCALVEELQGPLTQRRTATTCGWGALLVSPSVVITAAVGKRRAA